MARKAKNKPQERPENARARERRRKFVVLYCHPDYASNATRAAIDAGYSPRSAHVTACRMLKDELVAAEINAELERQLERTRVSGRRIVTELARIGRANLRDIVEVRMAKRGTGKRASIRPELFLKADSLDQLHPDDAAAIKDIEVTKDGIRVKLHDKRAALGLLSQWVGGKFRDPLRTPPRAQYTPEQRIALLLGLLQIMAKRRKESLALPEGQQIA